MTNAPSIEWNYETTKWLNESMNLLIVLYDSHKTQQWVDLMVSNIYLVFHHGPDLE